MLSFAPSPFPRGSVQSQACICSSLHRENEHCAEDSHLHHEVDTFLSSVAPPPLRHLDHTRPHLAAGDCTGYLGHPFGKLACYALWSRLSCYSIRDASTINIVHSACML